jgi:hypothetical protein
MDALCNQQFYRLNKHTFLAQWQSRSFSQFKGSVPVLVLQGPLLGLWTFTAVYALPLQIQIHYFNAS